MINNSEELNHTQNITEVFPSNISKTKSLDFLVLDCLESIKYSSWVSGGQKDNHHPQCEAEDIRPLGFESLSFLKQSLELCSCSQKRAFPADLKNPAPQVLFTLPVKAVLLCVSS